LFIRYLVLPEIYIVGLQSASTFDLLLANCYLTTFPFKLAPAMTAPPIDQKQVPVSQNADSGSSQLSKQERPSHGSYDDHPFSDRVTAQYWREVYDKAEYEGRHRFDPNYTWTAKEERKLVRKVGAQSRE